MIQSTKVGYYIRLSTLCEEALEGCGEKLDTSKAIFVTDLKIARRSAESNARLRVLTPDYFVAGHCL